MPNNNYNYGPSYVMNSDKTAYNAPDAPLTREGKDFDTSTSKITELNSMTPKKQSKPTVEASFNTMADDKNYF
jgi:hypothetical protein